MKCNAVLAAVAMVFMTVAAAAQDSGQPVILNAPDMTAPLGMRWSWALEEAQSGRTEHFWLAYANEDALLAGNRIFFGAPCGRGTSLQTLIDGTATRTPALVLLFRLNATPEVAMDRMIMGGAEQLVDFEGFPVYWLGKAEDTESVTHLELALNSLSGLQQQVAVVRALGLHASSMAVLPILGRILKEHTADRVRTQAVESLRCHPGTQAFDMAAEAAEGDSSMRVRREAVQTIGRIGTPGATPLLLRLALEAPDARVRAEAAQALGRQPSEEGMPALEQVIFQAPDVRTQKEGVEALSRFGDTALPLLERIVWDGQIRAVGAEAVETIGDIGTAAALEMLVDVIELHEDARYFDEAMDAVEKLDTARASELLIAAAKLNPLPQARREAIDHLNRIIRDHYPATSEEGAPLIEVLETAAKGDPDMRVRQKARESLRRIEDRN